MTNSTVHPTLSQNVFRSSEKVRPKRIGRGLKLEPIVLLVLAYFVAMLLPVPGSWIASQRFLGSSSTQWLLGGLIFTQSIIAKTPSPIALTNQWRTDLPAIIGVPIGLGLAISYSVTVCFGDQYVYSCLGLVIATAMPVAGTAIFWGNQTQVSSKSVQSLILITTLLSPAVMLFVGTVLFQYEASGNLRAGGKSNLILSVGLHLFGWCLLPLLAGKMVAPYIGSVYRESLAWSVHTFGMCSIAFLNYCSLSSLLVQPEGLGVGHSSGSSLSLARSSLVIVIYFFLLAFCLCHVRHLRRKHSQVGSEGRVIETLGCTLRNTGAGLVISSSLFPSLVDVGLTLALFAISQHVVVRGLLWSSLLGKLEKDRVP